MKYAIVDNGSSQLMLAEGETVLVDGTDMKAGSEYTWDKVLLLRNDKDIKVGTPYVKGVKVTGKVGEEVKGPKVVNFKKKRRKGYTRKVGHRQKYTEVMVEEIK